MPDFFAFSKVLPLLVYPLPLVLLVLVVLSFVMRPAVVRWIVRLLAVGLWVLATPWCANKLSTWWEVPRVDRAQLPAVSDAAIVLGGMSDPKVSTPEHLELGRAAERLTEAAALWREARVKAVVVTSGSGELLKPQAEAPGLAAWLRAQGVPASSLVVESASRNTRENATLTLPLVEAKGYKTLVLITSAVHMKRAQAIFRKAGYASGGRTLVAWPVDTQRNAVEFPFNAVPDADSLATTQTVLREALGYWVYSVVGYL